MEFLHDTERSVFVLADGNDLAASIYYHYQDAHTLVIDHTIVEEAYEGQGLGKKILANVVEYAREEKLKIIPLCPFANKVFSKTAEYNDVLA